MNVLRRKVQNIRKINFHAHRALAAGEKCQHLPVEFADMRARLHLHGHSARRAECMFDDKMCLGERSFGRGLVALVGDDRAVVRHFIENRRRAGLKRSHAVHHRRQGFVIDRNRFAGVARHRHGLRNHHRHWFADKARLVARERQVRPLEYRAAVLTERFHLVIDHACRIGALVHAARARSHEILGGINRDDAIHRLGGLRIDSNDPGMGVRRADEIAVKLIRQCDVVGIAALAGNQPEILQPGHPAADIRFTGLELGIGHSGHFLGVSLAA